MSRNHRASMTVWPAVALLAGLALPAAVAAPATDARAADATCVGKGEYKAIHGGMTIEKLGKVLEGQTPFADLEGRGKQRLRWYAACDAWQPEKDVLVRYHQPVVGRRTVTRKALAVYMPPAG